MKSTQHSTYIIYPKDSPVVPSESTTICPNEFPRSGRKSVFDVDVNPIWIHPLHTPYSPYLYGATVGNRMDPFDFPWTHPPST